MSKKKKKQGGMGKVLKILVLLFLVIVVAPVVGVVAYGFSLPSEYRFERSTVIDADPDEVHEYVGDLSKWEEWGPWKEQDPTIEITASDPSSGVGAKQSWTGESGKGSLVITSTDPDKGVEYDMEFNDHQFDSKGAVRYEETKDGKTKVTWVMYGDNGNNVIARIMTGFMDEDMNKMFDSGLAKLKKKVED